MSEPIEEILIYEITDKKATSPRYKIKRSTENFGALVCFPPSPNCIWVGYPFEILFWALPRLLNSPYKDRNMLEASPNVLDDMIKKISPGSLFDSDKPLEAELMERHRREFPEDHKRHFG